MRIFLICLKLKNRRILDDYTKCKSMVNILPSSTHRLVSDDQIAKWNNSSKYIVITDNNIDFDILAEEKYIYTVQYENGTLKKVIYTE